MIVAQISDMHVSSADTDADAAFAGAAGLAAAIKHLNGLRPRPSMVLATGDLVAIGKAEEYVRLRALLDDLDLPVYLMPGNHDDRELMREAFPDHSYLPPTGFLNYEIDAGPYRILMLDTVVTGQSHGELCAERLDWLAESLGQAPERPTMVCLHHPPFLTGIGKMDETILRGADGFGRIVAANGQIERVSCGHLHRPITRRYHGTVASTCPSTAFQIVLDLEDVRRLGVIKEAPACYLHFWHADEGLVSHTSIIGDFEQTTIFENGQWQTPG